ncbi:MAG: type IIL restriction-modification enzyme MmeI, partial [Saprospiraceae bacterium]
ICQGEQVFLLWTHILSLELEISFAYKSFKWSNSAKEKAAVICVIIGVRKKAKKNKILFDGSLAKKVINISPYLTATGNVIVSKRTYPLVPVPALVYGNQAIEGGHLILSDSEKNNLLKMSPNANVFIRPLYGADDYLNGNSRWCIWINENNLNLAQSIPEINNRIENVKKFREQGGEVAQSLVAIPYRFRYIHEAKSSILVLPRTTSERREYLAIGFLTNEAVVTDAAQVIYDPEPYILGILSTKIHLAWVKAVGGKLKMDPRYSNLLCYNTFPFPIINQEQKQELERNVYQVLSEREKHSEKTLAQLYDPDKMPNGLRDAHHQLDLAVERCYRSKPFESDEERLEYLFKLYEQMIAEEKTKGTLFEAEAKPKKKRK